MRLCTFFTTAILCSGFSLVSGDEVTIWNFDDSEVKWTPNDQVELQAVDGTLMVKSTGRDPYFSAPVNAAAGWHQLTIKARHKGRADLQVFWSTEKQPGTSEANSVRSDLRGNESEFKEFAIWFRTDSPLTALRLDPMSRGGRMEIDSITLSADPPPAPKATPVEDMHIADGFQVELLYPVRGEEYGSWVSMTVDPKGRLIVSDQYGKLYRVTPPPAGSNQPTTLEAIDVEVGMAQGLLYAFDSLYVMVNGTNAENQGLYRVTDSDGDDKFDSVEWLRKIVGGGEHGPHAVTLSPDGKSLYVCAGNHTDPVDFEKSRVPRNWDEDQLLPRMWDAGGHAVGKMAPGGWIAKVSPDGKEWELVASGFRNEYDIAFNSDGELFTYDADMEWDVGTPWYRPTRVNHVTSGAEFGWRSGTGKWPSYYPDSLPAVVDIGPGSPTGIVFGTGADFPERYQKALFISDWSYGVIYAVHMTPSGSSYTAKAEQFISAAPLPVTDLVINPVDNALYFTIGGRRTQSALYRVTYAGDEAKPAVADSTEAKKLRELRHRLESLHHDDAADAVNKAWPYLGHSDRHIRFAARIAIEHRPVEEWATSAITENSNPDAKLTALLALARNGEPHLQGAVLGSLAGLAKSELTVEQQLTTLRVLTLTFIRMQEPSADQAKTGAELLTKYYPSRDPRLNRELCAMLVYLQDPSVAEKTLQLMKTSATQEEQLHYALCLRALKSGWSLDSREEYYRWFLEAAALRGGHSFGGFIKNIRQESIDTLSADEAEALKELLAMTPEGSEPTVEAASRPFVREWQVEDLLPEVQAGLQHRNFENGRNMFVAAACYKCHRFAGQGGIVGPDVTGVGRRFNARTLLESIIEPSKVISDQYEAQIFLLESGQQVSGRVVNLNGKRLMVSENMLDPGNLTTVNRDEIEESFTSKVSMMPKGLINNLTRDDILDLVAYLQSGGDPNADAFMEDDVTQTGFTPNGHTTDSLAIVKSRIRNNTALLIDVREQDEWNAGHLQDASLVPLSEIRKGEIPQDIANLLPKDKPVYCHCRSGRRVLSASKVLRAKGYDIRPLAAGYSSLLNAGFQKAD